MAATTAMATFAAPIAPAVSDARTRYDRSPLGTGRFRMHPHVTQPKIWYIRVRKAR